MGEPYSNIPRLKANKGGGKRRKKTLKKKARWVEGPTIAGRGL